MATVVEIHRDGKGNVVGYEVELFTADGRTFAVASIPADVVRKPTPTDQMASRIAELHS